LGTHEENYGELFDFKKFNRIQSHIFDALLQPRKRLHWCVDRHRQDYSRHNFDNTTVKAVVRPKAKYKLFGSNIKHGESLLEH
jgi:hypothetical protein